MFGYLIFNSIKSFSIISFLGTFSKLKFKLGFLFFRKKPLNKSNIKVIFSLQEIFCENLFNVFFVMFIDLVDEEG